MIKRKTLLEVVKGSSEAEAEGERENRENQTYQQPKYFVLCEKLYKVFTFVVPQRLGAEHGCEPLFVLAFVETGCWTLGF